MLFRSPAPALGQQLPDHSVEAGFIVLQGEGLRALFPRVVSDGHRAQAVDGAEGELVPVLLPKKAISYCQAFSNESLYILA